MDLKRRIALSAALLAVGLGAGHLVQNRSAKPPTQKVTADMGDAKVTDITPLAAGSDETTAPVAEQSAPAPTLSDAAMTPGSEPVADSPIEGTTVALADPSDATPPSLRRFCLRLLCQNLLPRCCQRQRPPM